MVDQALLIILNILFVQNPWKLRCFSQNLALMIDVAQIIIEVQERVIHSLVFSANVLRPCPLDFQLELAPIVKFLGVRVLFVRPVHEPSDALVK